MVRPILRLAAAAAVGALAATGSAAPTAAQNGNGAWDPPRLDDGQIDLNGTWNNVGSAHIPLELPESLAGREVSQEDIEALVRERSDRSKAVTWQGHENSRGVGAYANYWFDWYWKEPAGVDAPALLIEPASGRMPALTEKAQASVQWHREHLHDSYATMETGDRCLSRGTYGVMMPTAYNNGKMFFHTSDHLVILSEMIHNARVIPIDAGPHADSGIRLWNGDPRARWEGNGLVVESRNFKAVENQRGPGSRAPQTQARHVVERFTLIDDGTLRYELRVDDPETYTAPWTVAFNYKRDNNYVQFEYACHEGNYAVPNSLSGQRAQERQ